MPAHRPRIVVLDGQTLNPGDLSWARLQSLGRVEVYDHSTREEILDRGRKAGIILANKARIDASMLDRLPDLKCICVTATGYNNIDIEAAARKGIPVCNAVGYSSASVAQHVFALLLELTNHIGMHDQSVKKGDWSRQPHFSYQLKPLSELDGKTMGIYGFGNIGQHTARIARGFGMEVLAVHKHPERDARPDVRFVDLETLFRESDVVSLHAPLTDENAEVVNEQLLSLMKPTAFLINTARGGLVNETDLKRALEKGVLAGAGLDVLATEPPPEDHPLFGAENCLITPHQAWATLESRERLLEITIENIRAFLKGAPRNVVNGV